MPDLIAQGPNSGQRWRREVPAVTSGVEVSIGRSDADWTVPWDTLISRTHVNLVPKGDDRVEVSRLASARNPIFHNGRQNDRFILVPGEHFVVGKTTFTLANRPGASDSPVADDVTEHAYDHTALRRRHFNDATSRIEILSKLPALITGSSSDEELLVRVTGVLLQATASASAVAIVSASETDSSVNVMHYDCRIPSTTDGPQVSAKLVRSSVKKRESVLHLWSGGRRDSALYTASEEVDWAFCVPLRSESCPGWALYVTGQLASLAGGGIEHSMQAAPDDLEDDVKFAELVGTTLANVRQGRRLERRQAAMRRFFAPVVMDALAGRDTDEVLSPREADLSVLFCDLRGFSKQSEEDAGQLLRLLGRVSEALGVMTKHILETGGVIGDFHGDAAMGFWGWPLEQKDMAARAARAATKIWSDYRSNSGSLQFRCGIGIASGRAVAGRIGTIDQVKVTAFGPVVNLASRLEGMTKQFGAEIIVDEPTAEILRAAIAGGDETFRVRRLATVRPAGMSTPVQISELIVVVPGDDSVLSNAQIQMYESSLEAMNRGDWDAAYRDLHDLPASDRPKDVLLGTILRHNRVPPPTWDGVLDLPK